MAQQPDLACPYCFAEIHNCSVTDLLGEDSATQQWQFYQKHLQHSKGGAQ